LTKDNSGRQPEQAIPKQADRWLSAAAASMRVTVQTAISVLAGALENTAHYDTG